VYTPLSEEEIDIQNRIKRLYTLTEQLKVEAQARKGDRMHVTDVPETKKVALRFPVGTKIHEIMARLNHVGVKIEEAEKSVSKLLITG
jgi:septation ring formation regulator EzrA